MNILICGDSFASDYSVTGQSLEYIGWPQLLAKNYNITNLAQAGCGEYKIYLQTQQANIKNFDCAIIFHTSPYRIYVKEHPTLKDTCLHKNSDLIYHDIKNQDWFEDQQVLTTFFEKYFDLDHAKFVHELIQEKIKKFMIGIPTFHTGINLCDLNFDASYIFKKYRGNVNHFDRLGNELMAKQINKWIQSL